MVILLIYAQLMSIMSSVIVIGPHFRSIYAHFELIIHHFIITYGILGHE